MMTTALMITGAGLVLASGTAVGLVMLLSEATAHALADRARLKALRVSAR
jgi:hypothetical protein